MTSDSERVIELDLPPDMRADPDVAAALEKLSEALAAEGALLDDEVEGFGFGAEPLRIDGMQLGKAPTPVANEFVCFGNYYDDEKKTSSCGIRFG